MASDDKKIKTDPAPKNEVPSKNKSTSNEAPPKDKSTSSEAPPKDKSTSSEAPPKDKSTSSVEPSKAEGGEKAADVPSSYSRGEGQKPVTQAYKDNWNAIFGTKKKKR
jgi:hypothetical protein